MSDHTKNNPNINSNRKSDHASNSTSNRTSNHNQRNLLLLAVIVLCCCSVCSGTFQRKKAASHRIRPMCRRPIPKIPGRQKYQKKRRKNPPKNQRVKRTESQIKNALKRKNRSRMIRRIWWKPTMSTCSNCRVRRVHRAYRIHGHTGYTGHAEYTGYNNRTVPKHQTPAGTL